MENNYFSTFFCRKWIITVIIFWQIRGSGIPVGERQVPYRLGGLPGVRKGNHLHVHRRPGLRIRWGRHPTHPAQGAGHRGGRWPNFRHCVSHKWIKILNIFIYEKYLIFFNVIIIQCYFLPKSIWFNTHLSYFKKHNFFSLFKFMYGLKNGCRSLFIDTACFVIGNHNHFCFHVI